MFIPAKLKKTLRLFIVLLGVFSSTISAQAFVEEARSFTNKPAATAEQNQDYIVKLNQFIAEEDFSSAELAEILFIRAVVFSRLKDTENALKSYGAALNSRSLIPILLAETYKNRGLLYYGVKQYQPSADDFENALEILAGNAELHYYLANSYFGLRLFNKAITQYENALDGMANNRFLAYYGIASIYYSQKQFEISKQYLQKSLDDNKDFKLASDMLSKIDAPLTPAQKPDEKAEEAPKKLTSNEVYNQLLTQALSQQKGEKQTFGIKLDDIIVQEKPKIKSNIIEQAKSLDGLLRAQEKPKIIQYYLQLSSSNSRKNSETYYTKMLKKHQLLLANKPYLIREFKNKSGKTFYQLLLSNFKSYKQANAFCQLIKAQNSDCFVRRL